MASWTDSIPKFNPYVQQLPVEAMVQVGMEKQKRYDEGVQKIQSYIDNIANLPMMRDVDKRYLQTKLNELGGTLNVLAASDFSNSQLVTSVGGMTNNLVRDKYIRSAVQSTEWHKKQQQIMEEERKKGTLTPDNELNYSKQLTNYVSNNRLSTEDGGAITFNGTYKPYFDVFKFAKETFDALKPDNFSFDQVYVTGADGKPIIGKDGKPVFSPVLVRMEKEGIFPAKVKDALDQIFSDPRVTQQLQITGEYNYRNYNSDALFSKVDQQRTASLATLDQAILDLNLKKNNGQKVDTQIDDLMKKREIVLKNYQSYADLAIDNPDAVRGQLYRDDINDRYTTMFGWTKTKESYHDNPGWKANFEMIKEANQQSRFAQTLGFQMQKHRDDMIWKQLEFEQNERLGKGKGRGKTAGGGGGAAGDMLTEQADQPSSIDILKQFENEYNTATENFINGSDEFIWNSVYSGQAANDAELSRLMRGGMDKSQAIRNIIDRNAKQAGVSPEEYRATWGDKAASVYNRTPPNNRTPKMKESYEMYNTTKRNYSSMKAMYDDSGVKDMKVSNVESMPIVYDGKRMTLTGQDITDIALYYQGSYSGAGFLVNSDVRNMGKQAYKRLEQKGLGDLADQVRRTIPWKDWKSGRGAELTLKNPITSIVRGVRQAFSNISPEMSNSDMGRVTYATLDALEKTSNSEYLQKTADRITAIRNRYGILPNRKMGIVTGNAEEDKAMLANLRRIAGAGTAGQKLNLSTDFSEFSKNLPSYDKLDEYGLEAQVIMDAYGKPQVEVVLYDNDGERKAGMTLQPDEAYNNFGIDINTLYEAPTISTMKNFINMNGGRTSAGPVDDYGTYRAGDAYFSNNDFPGLANINDVDIKVNYEYYNGKYFPYVYANNGRVENILALPGLDNLTTSVSSLQSVMSPSFIENILKSAK